MKTKLLWICSLFLVTSACKKEVIQKDPEELLPSDYSIQVENDFLEGEAGGFATVRYTLLHKGVNVPPDFDFKYSATFNPVDHVPKSPAIFISGLSDNYTSIKLPVLTGEFEYYLRLIYNYTGQILDSAKIRIKIIPRTDDWVLKEPRAIMSMVEQSPSSIFMTNGYTLFKADRNLDTFIPVFHHNSYYELVNCQQNTLCALQYPGRILLSEDGGLHFKRLTAPVGKLEKVWMHGNDLMAASAGVCKVSKDKGATWQDFFVQEGLIKVIRLSDGTYIALGKEGLHRATDATGPAQKLSFSLPITDIAAKGNMLYILAGSDLYSSANQGNSFQKIGALEPGSYQSFEVKNNRFYLSTNSRQLRATTDLQNLNLLFTSPDKQEFKETKYMALSENRVFSFGKYSYCGYFQH